MLTEEERKQRRKESQRRYRETHKEKRAEYSKMYNKKHYWEHKEENQETHNKAERERYQKNKVQINAQLRERYSNDPEYRERVLQQNKKNRENNPETMEKWRSEHKDEISEYNAEYSKTPIGRAHNLLSSYRHNDKIHERGECTLTAHWIIENIFSKPCVYCGETGWEIIGCDRINNSLPHTPENCVPCCGKCNSKKGSIPYEEYLKMLAEQPC